MGKIDGIRINERTNERNWWNWSFLFILFLHLFGRGRLTDTEEDEAKGKANKGDTEHGGSGTGNETSLIGDLSNLDSGDAGNDLASGHAASSRASTSLQRTHNEQGMLSRRKGKIGGECRKRISQSERDASPYGTNVADGELQCDIMSPHRGSTSAIGEQKRREMRDQEQFVTRSSYLFWPLIVFSGAYHEY